MVSLHIQNLSKKFGTHWVLKDVELSISPYEKIAILGDNGSGKSTLLKIMAGFVHHEKGTVLWTDESTNRVSGEPDFSFSGPYLDLFDHLTVEEQLGFHFRQKPLLNGVALADLYQIGALEPYRNKFVRQLSSGLKQRLKNVLAIFSNAPVLFMDEPCSNLDEENTVLYRKLMETYTKGKTVIIASNQSVEYDFICTKEFKIEQKALNLLRNKQLWA